MSCQVGTGTWAPNKMLVGTVYLRFSLALLVLIQALIGIGVENANYTNIGRYGYGYKLIAKYYE